MSAEEPANLAREMVVVDLGVSTRGHDVAADCAAASLAHELITEPLRVNAELAPSLVGADSCADRVSTPLHSPPSLEPSFSPEVIQACPVESTVVLLLVRTAAVAVRNQSLFATRN